MNRPAAFKTSGAICPIAGPGCSDAWPADSIANPASRFVLVRLDLALLLLDRLLLRPTNRRRHGHGGRSFLRLQCVGKSAVVFGDLEPPQDCVRLFAVNGRLARPFGLSSVVRRTGHGRPRPAVLGGFTHTSLQCGERKRVPSARTVAPSTYKSVLSRLAGRFKRGPGSRVAFHRPFPAPNRCDLGIGSGRCVGSASWLCGKSLRADMKLVMVVALPS